MRADAKERGEGGALRHLQGARTLTITDHLREDTKKEPATGVQIVTSYGRGGGHGIKRNEAL